MPKAPQIILGIDPGMAVTGWGIIEYAGDKPRLIDHGTIVTAARDPHHERLEMIHEGIQDVIDSFHPEQAAIEEIFSGVNIRTALALGQARGVIILACAGRGLKPADYTPLRIKQAVTGYGRASKVQVQQMVKVLLGLPKVPKPDHASDALAIAICHAHTMKTTKAVGLDGRGGSGGRPRLKRSPTRSPA